ncbi:MAG: 16S rRNA (guanine(966)-N(2))-methyltransferase RsmD [Firmicutes bacterium]|nr:16S rRNA (guanine(966)-N(2))-methyltransferase RsmD [Bacillota bacterium]
MRVISGSAKGRKLKAPPGLNTRPITDMIKGALFNVWGTRVAGCTLLDLFAGSGSVGIEALSRGAQKVVFVDNSRAAVQVIKENLSNCRFDQTFTIYPNDVMSILMRLNRQGDRFDLVYIDPPFTIEKICEEVMLALDEVDILETDGIVVIRTQRRKEMSDFKHLHKYRQSNYGDSSLHYYFRYEEDPKDDGNFPNIG